MSTSTSRPASSGLAVKADPRAMQFKTLFESDKFQLSLRQALPKHMDSGRLIRVTLSAFQTNPRLLECTPETVMLSLMRAAAMGLEPDGGPLGQGYLVPFWNGKAKRLDCQFIPGYRGLIKLACNSGQVADVWAEVAYDADQFDYELGLEPTIRHKRNDEVTDPGPLKYAYAVARFTDGAKKFTVMNRREVEEIKAKSSSRDKQGNLVGPWIDWPAEMWKKTAVRRLCKMLPLSVEDQRRMAAEDLADTGVESIIIPDMIGHVEPAPQDGETTTDDAQGQT